MKKVIWSSALFLFVFWSITGCNNSNSAGTEKETKNVSNIAMGAPLPGSALEATGVHEISYGVMRFLGNNYLTCNCQPRLDTLYFGSFLSNEAIQNQLSSEDFNGVYLHLCLNSSNQFYLALSGAEGIADSLLKPDTYYPKANGSFKYKSNSFDNFFAGESFAIPGNDSIKGSVIMDDRSRFAQNLTCDLDGNNTQDSLSTIPYGFVNRGELEELIGQSTASKTAFLMGYDPTMYPSVMRVMMASTKPHGTNEIKFMQMKPSAPSQYALFLERNRP